MSTPEQQASDPHGPEAQGAPPGAPRLAAPPPRYAPPQYAPPQYAPPQYEQTPYQPQPWRAKNWMGVTSLVLSLLGLVTGITAIAGIVFGHLSLSAVKHGEADNRSTGLAGLIVGYVVTGLGILVLIISLVFVGWVITECAGPNPADWCTSTG